MSDSTQYIALLRGINVSGHKKIKMADLKKLLSTLDFADIKTVLASGNVALTASGDAESIAQAIEAVISSEYGFDVPVIVRHAEAIRALVNSNPFAGIEVTDQTRLYITFLGPEAKSGGLDLPYESPDLEYRILRATDGEVFSVLVLSKKGGSTKAMDILGKTYGKDITTRNWNTVKKLMNL